MTNLTFVAAVIIVAVAFALASNHGSFGFAQLGLVWGSGNVVEETRTLDKITGVALTTTGTLHIVQGEEIALRIRAEDNILPLLLTETSDGVLTIRTEHGMSIRPTQPIDYYLTVVDLASVRLRSSGKAEAGDLKVKDLEVRASSSGGFTMGDLTCDNLAVRISSSGSFTMGNLTSGTLTVQISSSGSVKLDGATGTSLDATLSSNGSLTIGGGEFERQSVHLSSSGSYHARDVRTRQATLKLSSHGSATVWVEDSLEANVSSSGSVRYAGSPTLRAHTSSSGTIKPLGD